MFAIHGVAAHVRRVATLRIICFAAALAAVFVPARHACAQEHPGNAYPEQKHPLHFSHPLVTESPTPDTKVRVDYFFRRLGEVPGSREHALRLEAEYAFLPGFSLEANAPIVWRHSAGTASVGGFGSTDLAVKLASFALARRGLLLGGGVEFGLPTGSDAKGIGSSHLVEIAPYVDVGYRRERLELVAFTSLQMTTNRRAGEPNERELATNASALFHLTRWLEALAESDVTRGVSGTGGAQWKVNVAPGVKLRPFGASRLVLGGSARVPVSGARDFEKELLVSALYHF